MKLLILDLWEDVNLALAWDCADAWTVSSATSPFPSILEIEYRRLMVPI